jgi:PAP_fibrillin
MIQSLLLKIVLVISMAGSYHTVVEAFTAGGAVSSNRPSGAAHQHQRVSGGNKPLFSTRSSSATVETLNGKKADLVRLCQQQPSSSKPRKEQVSDCVQDLEAMAEQLGMGQTSALSGLLSGEWELLYSPEDATRSSPFFWAFRKAFPEKADQIFGITDAIPAPIKEVGPAFQHIELNDSSTTSTQTTGRFVSRVRVATLGGMATSIMTTRASIVGIDGLDGIRLKIETTKPEDSTIVKMLFGPLGDIVNENAPPFPSGEALERVSPGSSEVILRTTFCDEGLRISRDGERINDIYVWKRREFASFDFL